jgi:hypothetical protein
MAKNVWRRFPTYVANAATGDFTNGGDIGWATITRDGDDAIIRCKGCGETHRVTFGPIMDGGHFNHRPTCAYVRGN